MSVQLTTNLLHLWKIESFIHTDVQTDTAFYFVSKIYIWVNLQCQKLDKYLVPKKEYLHDLLELSDNGRRAIHGLFVFNSWSVSAFEHVKKNGSTFC